MLKKKNCPISVEYITVYHRKFGQKYNAMYVGLNEYF